MILYFTVTEKDYMQFNIFHCEHSTLIKRQRLFVRFLLPVLLIAVNFFMIKQVDLFSVVLAVVFSIGWIAVLPLLLRRSLVRNIKKLIKEGNVNEFIGAFTMQLLDDKIRMEYNNCTIETPYKNIERICTDQERLYIYVGALSAYIIPVAAFQDEQDKQEFLNLLKDKSGQALSIG